MQQELLELACLVLKVLLEQLVLLEIKVPLVCRVQLVVLVQWVLLDLKANQAFKALQV